MAKKKNISAVISLKDNFSATLRGVKREQKAFQREVRQTKKAMDSAFKQKMKARLDATQAHKAFERLKKDTRYIQARKKLVQTIIAKDMAMQKIKKVKSAMSSIGKAIAKPVIMAKDKATSAIKGISSKIGALAKGVAIPLAIITGGASAAIKGGMDLEKQQISMRHFMGVGNKGKSGDELDKMSADYLSQLRKNANETPFETGEVLSAGTRALQISNGSVSEAMKKVKLAEDMAALNPGKTISDAMEALADMEMGEYARLTEFGVKATKDSGDSPQSVQKELEGMYTGGAGKLATSGSGLLSTITGKLKSNTADIGQSVLEPLKPVMTQVIGFIDKVTPKMLEFGTKLGEGIGNAITFISENFPIIMSYIEPVISSLKGAFEVAVPVISDLITSLSPVFSGLLTVASVVMQGIGNVVQFVAPVVSDLIGSFSPVFSNVGSALSSLGNIFSSIFDGIMNIVSKAYNFIKPLIDGIGSAVSGVSGAVSSGLGWVSSKLGGKTDRNATGTRYFGGGMSLVGEHGPELVQMPRGSKVFSNSETNNMLGGGSGINISIGSMVVREEADINKVAQAFVRELKMTKSIYGGVY